MSDTPEMFLANHGDPTTRDDGERFQTLLDAAAEFLLGAPDHEILEDLRAEGVDAGRIAQEARSALDQALRARGRRRLQAAREGLQCHREV